MDNLNLNLKLKYEFSKKLHTIFERKEKRLIIYETSLQLSSKPMILKFVVYKDLDDSIEDDDDFKLYMEYGDSRDRKIKDVILNKNDDILAQINYIQKTYKCYRCKEEWYILSPEEYEDVKNTYMAIQLVNKKINDYLTKV